MRTTHLQAALSIHIASTSTKEAWIEGPAEVAFFATVTSHFYPMLNSYYTARAEAWLAEIEAEQAAEREEEEQERLEKHRERLDGLTQAANWSLSDPAELPEDLTARAQVLLVGGHFAAAEVICDELGSSADDLRVMIAIKRSDTEEAIRLAREIEGRS